MSQAILLRSQGGAQSTAFVDVTANAGCTVTCTNRVQTYDVIADQEGHAYFELNRAGTWEFTSSLGPTCSLLVELGNDYEIDLYSDPIFGDGSDGEINWYDGEHIITAGDSTGYFKGAEDTGFIEINATNFTLTSQTIGSTTTYGSITAGSRNSGMIIRCTGDCTIDTGCSITNLLSPKIRLETGDELLAIFANYYPQDGFCNTGAGDGGAGGTVASATPGAGMSGRFYGGGWSGGGAGGKAVLTGTGGGTAMGGVGGNVTTLTVSIPNMFVGGAGGTGYGNAVGNPGSYGGGGGGAMWSLGIGGAGASGRGNNGGVGGKASGSSTAYCGGGGGAGNYGGGVVIIYCNGDLTIKGSISCGGFNGGIGGNSYSTASYGAPTKGGNGGGGGGGRVYLLRKGTFTDNGTYNVAGGTGANAGAIGTINKIDYATYRNSI